LSFRHSARGSLAEMDFREGKLVVGVKLIDAPDAKTIEDMVIANVRKYYSRLSR
jgi:hypothetical protein